jgi:hypothetical protein
MGQHLARHGVGVEEGGERREVRVGRRPVDPPASEELGHPVAAVGHPERLVGCEIDGLTLADEADSLSLDGNRPLGGIMTE